MVLFWCGVVEIGGGALVFGGGWGGWVGGGGGGGPPFVLDVTAMRKSLS